VHVPNILRIPAIVTGDSGRSWPVAKRARVALRRLYCDVCASL